MKYIKIDIPDRDCKGMMVSVADNSILESITDKKQFKPTSEYRITMRVTVRNDYKKFQKKITQTFHKKQTLLYAIDLMNAERVRIRNSLKEGTIQKERATNVKQDTPPTLNEAFDGYIKNKEHILKEKSIKSYKGFYNTWIRYSLGEGYIKDITKEQLQAIVNKILEQRAPRTAKTLKEILNPIFKNYNHHGLVEGNPVELLEFKKFDNTVHPTLNDSEIKALYKAIYNYEKEPFRSIFIWLSTGRRLNEVLSLKWSNVDLNNKTFTIKAENNKAGRGMTYELDDDLMGTLDKLEHHNGYIFHSIKDKRKKMHNDTIKRHWKKILDTANIEHLRVHDLRHIIGLKLVNAGVSLEVIASVLGHTTTAITKRYSKVRQETAGKAISKFKNMIK